MKLYEKYHENRSSEKRIITDYDFTHGPFLKTLSISQNKYKKILDIGCGTGTVCFYLASKGSFVTGVDISRKAIELAKLNSRNLNLSKKTRFYISDFPNDKIIGKFDLIVCSEVLEHIKDHTKAISKVYSLLEKNGHAFLSVPLKTSFLYRFNFLHKFDNEVGHLRRYSEKEFMDLIENSKFKILAIRKDQGLLRDYLFTSTRRSFLVAFANKFKLISKVLTFVDERFFPLGVSSMSVLVAKS